jgi:fused signal recognition particle receptor
MWDLLKSKVSNFIKQVKDENKDELKKEEEVEIPKEEEIIEIQKNKEEPEKEEIIQIIEEEKEKKEIVEKPKEEIIQIKKEVEIEKIPEIKIEKPEIKMEKNKMPDKPKTEDKMNVKVGLKEKITKTLLRKIKLNKNKVDEITEELELALIQADVHPEIAMEVCEKINERLIKSEYSSNNLENEIKNDLKNIFENEVFADYPKINVLELIRNNQEKPYKILFVGPNGAGKTTTIAKFANMIKNEGKKVVISASDTFRAAAIEQTEEHGKRLDVKVIRQNYGADAAAVAFDAIKHAEANDVDVVLIDSAGRQDNNTNLMRELEKIKRITKPHITIFIGEAISGNSLYQQVETYNGIVNLNGIILTKVDCDAKGGTAISIYRESKVPIIYLGMGQKYNDLKLFEPKDIIDKII